MLNVPVGLGRQESQLGGDAMYIHEATKLSLETGQCITRGCEGWEGVIKILPTNTSQYCIVVQIWTGRDIPSGIRWNPSAEDLAANDWKIVDKIEK